MNSALNYLYQVFTRPFTHIKLTPISTREISEIIKSLKWKYSHGYNEILIKILKISLPFILSPLTYVYVLYVLNRCPLAYFLHN